MSENTTKPRKKLKRYDIPGHAHELTFSCYHRFDYLNDTTSCLLFLDELERARDLFKFKLWAYVLMPNHVHLLLFPYEAPCKMSKILQSIKGCASKRYGEHLKATAPHTYQSYCIGIGDKKRFRFWQAGGGFDRNLWNAKAIHSSINYIEANPVRAELADAPEEWQWSSAHARLWNEGVIPDREDIPIQMQ